MKTTITERGQVSIPAELRRDMHLSPGQTVLCEKVSANECRLIIEPRTVIEPDPVRALNFAREHGLPQRPTDEVLAELREGKADTVAWVVDTSVLLDIRQNDPQFGLAAAECLARHLPDGL